MDYSPPGSSVHGISQARILEWVAISFPGDLPSPGTELVSPGGFFTSEPPGKPGRGKDLPNKMKRRVDIQRLLWAIPDFF